MQRLRRCDTGTAHTHTASCVRKNINIFKRISCCGSISTMPPKLNRKQQKVDLGAEVAKQTTPGAERETSEHPVDLLADVTSDSDSADERDVPKPATYPFCESPSCVATLSAHSHGVNSVAFHPKAPLLVTCSDDYTAKLWRFPPDGSAATCVATLSGHMDYVVCVAFHPTAPLLATGSGDYTAKLWRFSPDGSAATCVATLSCQRHA